MSCDHFEEMKANSGANDRHVVPDAAPGPMALGGGNTCWACEGPLRCDEDGCCISCGADLPQTFPDAWETLRYTRRLQDEAERTIDDLQRQIATLRIANLGALAEVEAWKLASGLEAGGDPDGVTPDAAQAFWERVEASRHRWKARYEQANERALMACETGCGECAGCLYAAEKRGLVPAEGDGE